MSEASRFGSLAQRVRAMMGQGDTSIIALATESGGQGGQGGDQEAPTTEVVETPAPPAPPAPPSPPPPAAPEPGEVLAADDPAHPAFGNGFVAANARVATVFASDASKGKERVAASLLTDSDMPADKIVALLPSLAANTSNSMLANLSANPNPDLAAGTEAGGAPPKASTRILEAQRGLTGKKPGVDQ